LKLSRVTKSPLLELKSPLLEVTATRTRPDQRRCDDFWPPHRSVLGSAVYRQTTITFGIHGPLVRSDLPGLCERVCGLLAESRASVALCDVSGIGADAVVVDALARLQLAAHRHGCQVKLRAPTPALRDLVAFMGLADVLVE
jgi:ABC-type transporter Mla MlaB component